MRDQTLHSSSVAVYHVCQCCNGAGCNVCADLVLIEGEIPDELGPDFDEINLDDWMDSNGVLHCSDTPINRVIGISVRDNERVLSSLVTPISSFKTKSIPVILLRNIGQVTNLAGRLVICST